MKKFLLLAILGLFTMGLNAQITSIPVPENSDFLKFSKPLDFNQLVKINSKRSFNKTEVAHRTFNYLSSSTGTDGTGTTTAGTPASFVVYPDSSIKAVYSNGTSYPFVHGFGQVFDPSSIYFDSSITKPIYYTKPTKLVWDTLQFSYSYNRVGDSKVVDTLYIDYHFKNFSKKYRNTPGQGLLALTFTNLGYKTTAVFVDTVTNLSYGTFKRDTVFLTNADSTVNTSKLITRKVGRTLFPESIVGFYATFKSGVKRTRNLNDTLFDFTKKDAGGKAILTYKRNTFFANYNTESNNIFTEDTSYNFAMLYLNQAKYKNKADSFNNKGRAAIIQPYNFKATTYDRLHMNAYFTLSATYQIGIEEIAKNGGYAVSNLFPNPTNGLSQFELTTPRNENVVITISNMVGQVVSTQKSTAPAGNTKFTINATDLNTGIYFYTVQAGKFSSTKKFSVSK